VSNDGAAENDSKDASEVIRKEAVRQVLGISLGETRATPRTQLDEFDQVRLARLRQLLNLRDDYAKWFRRILAAQLAVADIVFIIYAWAGVGWDVPTAAISAWLGAVVIQVIGIVMVITKGLFPSGETPDHSPPHHD
jgi:hypothetical protein